MNYIIKHVSFTTTQGMKYKKLDLESLLIKVISDG